MNPIAKSKKLARQHWRSQPIPEKNWAFAASQKIVAAIVATAEFKAAKQVSLFAPLPWEPDLSGVWKSAPQKCVLPKIDLKNDRIDFFFIDTWSDLSPGGSNILEPSTECPARSWSPGDIILVPAQAVDEQGNRLGSGKGYYDRFLSELPHGVLRWAVVFHSRISKTPLPVESFDQKVDLIFSELGPHPSLE